MIKWCAISSNEHQVCQVCPLASASSSLENGDNKLFWNLSLSFLGNRKKNGQPLRESAESSRLLGRAPWSKRMFGWRFDATISTRPTRSRWGLGSHCIPPKHRFLDLTFDNLDVPNSMFVTIESSMLFFLLSPCSLSSELECHTYHLLISIQKHS